MLFLIPLAFWHWWRERPGWFKEVFLLLPATTFFVLMSAMAYQIGVRYLLPVFPLLFIFLVFALIRGAFGGWGRRYGGGWGGGYYQSPRERLEELHKEMHGEKPKDTGTTSPPPSGR